MVIIDYYFIMWLFDGILIVIQKKKKHVILRWVSIVVNGDLEWWIIGARSPILSMEATKCQYVLSIFWGSTTEKAFLFRAGMGRTPFYLMFHRPNDDPIAVQGRNLAQHPDFFHENSSGRPLWHTSCTKFWGMWKMDEQFTFQMILRFWFYDDLSRYLIDIS